MRILFILTFLAYTATGFSQANEDEAVKEVIHRVFKAMELGDSAMLRTAFVKEPATGTVLTNKAGEVVLRQQTGIDDFARAVGSSRDQVWYEEVWNLDVRRDGDMAQAWCDYAFYVGNKFSHCGVDVFHLVKSKDGWKIFHLADTRKTTGCDVPAEIQAKHK